MSDPLLAINDIHTYYGDSYVLQGISMQLGAGRIVAILGRNGMGKTTLIRSVAGLTPPRSGEVLFKGQSLNGCSPYMIAQRGIALVPQGRRVFSSLTVLENLALPTSRLARPQSGRWNLQTVLAEFPQLQDRIENLGTELSGGEQQMLAIGRALMANPTLVLMDEPSEGLSPRLVLHVGEIMKRLRDYGLAVMLVEQNLSLALSVADDIYVLSSGRLVFHGSAQELANDAATLNYHLGVGSKDLQ